MRFTSAYPIFFLVASASNVLSTSAANANSGIDKREPPTHNLNARSTPSKDELAVRGSSVRGFDDVNNTGLDDGVTSAELEKRRTIDEWAITVNAGFATVQTIAAAVSNYLSSRVKAQSDDNSCAVISGNIDGVNYQYQATTSGKNCDTTAEVKTINDAITKALEWMEKGGGTAACFKLSHGGTWVGLLQLATSGTSIVNGKCATVTYNLPI